MSTDFHNIDGTYYRKEPLGVIPQVLEYLWSTRKATRATMKHTTDPDMLSTLNAQQLSYKLGDELAVWYTWVELLSYRLTEHREGCDMVWSQAAQHDPGDDHVEVWGQV